MKRAIYPGSFDPITLGHVNILERSLKIYDEIIIVVLNNQRKNYTFDQQMRKTMIEKTLEEHNVTNCQVAIYDGLLIDFAKSHAITNVIRGLRMVTDFEYEFQLNAMNTKLYPELETHFLMSDEKYSFLSSSTIREIAYFGGDVAPFVSKYVNDQLATAKAK